MHKRTEVLAQKALFSFLLVWLLAATYTPASELWFYQSLPAELQPAMPLINLMANIVLAVWGTRVIFKNVPGEEE